MKKSFLLTYLVLFFLNFSTVFSQPVPLTNGSKAPEIKLPSPKGDTITLSSLKNKLVLIDFWGTWCAPCVKEQPELAKLYKKFKNKNFKTGKGFEIYGVSLDAKKEQWVGGIHNLKIDWIQVSDLRFWRSPVAKTYHIQELPFNLLIDGNGTILNKNLHGAELEQEISKQLIN